MPRNVFGILPLMPAYCRDYKNKKEVIQAFEANKDFRTPSGQYINKSQFRAGDVVTIRYSGLKKVMSLTVKE